MRSALAILGETGRADFTVLEVVERSKTSLRSFYQHFSTKDELLLALIERIMAESTQAVAQGHRRPRRRDRDGRLIDRISAPAASTTQDSINRGLTFYNDHLAETMPREYARVLSPVHELIKDIIKRGIAEGAFRTGPGRRNHRGADHAGGAGRDAAARRWEPNSTARPSRATTSTSSAARPHSTREPASDLVDARFSALWCFLWSKRGNVITTHEPTDFQEAAMPAASCPIRCSTPTTTCTSPRKR